MTIRALIAVSNHRVQIVLLSNRPRIATETLGHVEAWMPFVDTAVVVCPGHQVDAFRISSRLDILAIDESRLLGPRHRAFASTRDHQSRNLLLRASLAEADVVDDEFLMADDDSRPLGEISPELFKANGRYRAYYYADLAQWRAHETDYDRGQHLTRELLADRGFPTLSYSAHMPQILQKTLLAEVLATFPRLVDVGSAVDEWSLYFNVARELHPELFHPPEPFRTLCWPALPTDWETGVAARGPDFENFYPELYSPGRLFAGLPTAHQGARQAAISVEKIRRRQALRELYDSRRARLLRRVAWKLHHSFGRGQDVLADHPALARILTALTPPPLRRFVATAIARGDDPAWSLQLLTSVRLR